MHDASNKLQRLCEATERAQQNLLTENSADALAHYARLSARRARGMAQLLRRWAAYGARLTGSAQMRDELKRLDVEFWLVMQLAQESLMLSDAIAVREAQLLAVDILSRQAQITLDLQAADQPAGPDLGQNATTATPVATPLPGQPS